MQKRIRINNLPLFISCFEEFGTVTVKYREEIDGDIFVTVEAGDDCGSFDEEKYQLKREKKNDFAY